MSTVQLQFHAEPEELVELTAGWARPHKLDHSSQLSRTPDGHRFSDTAST